MRIADQIPDKQKQQLSKMKSPKKEKFSKKDIEELMGVRQPTYKRYKGAMRQK
jgi:hypothetical protein